MRGGGLDFPASVNAHEPRPPLATWDERKQQQQQCGKTKCGSKYGKGTNRGGLVSTNQSKRRKKKGEKKIYDSGGRWWEKGVSCCFSWRDGGNAV